MFFVFVLGSLVVKATTEKAGTLQCIKIRPDQLGSSEKWFC